MPSMWRKCTNPRKSEILTLAGMEMLTDLNKLSLETWKVREIWINWRSLEVSGAACHRCLQTRTWVEINHRHRLLRGRIRLLQVQNSVVIYQVSQTWCVHQRFHLFSDSRSSSPSPCSSWSCNRTATSTKPANSKPTATTSPTPHWAPMYKINTSTSQPRTTTRPSTNKQWSTPVLSRHTEKKTISTLNPSKPN